jgi:hypothetical protein
MTSKIKEQQAEIRRLKKAIREKTRLLAEIDATTASLRQDAGGSLHLLPPNRYDS